ncbi:MAG TPA: Hint domain-containing protein [Archangium sp.]|uniref:Hint domain-containing protein n=1 Tax=Archangium sp. TaxID=1872627 RepID=UPI002E340D5B|nr:Hint domain-containing protein [Archangium sp.]HEX5749863.1 Hint domain-containing protein [Archangium sp.]
MRSRFLTLMMVAALSSACGQQRQTPATEEVDEQQLAEDSREMARRYSQWQASLRAQAIKTGDNEKMPLDLSDEVHYRFVMNRLKASGLSALNAPLLFLRLDELHRRLPLPERPMEAPVVGMTATADGMACGHMIPLGLSGSDTAYARFNGTGLTSCFGGSDYGYVDLTAFVTDEDQTSFQFLASESHEEYAGKVLETPPLELAVPRQDDKQLLVDSLAMAFNETTGEEQLTYTSVSATLHPVPGLGEGDIVLEHPKDLLKDTPEKHIRVCLERGALGGYLDCDYGLVRQEADGTWTPFPASGATGIAGVDVAATRDSGTATGVPTWIPNPGAYFEAPVKPVDPARFQLPMRGHFMPHVLEECQVTKVTSKVAAILVDAGGWCEAGTAAGTVVGKGELPWKVAAPSASGAYPFDGIVDFGTGNCLMHAQNVRLEMWVYTEGTCPDPYGGEPEPFRCPSKKVVSPVDYKRGCLAEGTRVTRADGRSVRVEQVKVGEKLLTQGTGRALTVTSVTRGGESQPLVKLRDEQGREVRVTQTHPLVTAARGVVQASELKVGDAVLTRTGARKLVAVERVPYAGAVYNFALGTPEELAGLGPEASTLYAGGFLVGDSQLQESLEKARRVDARALLTRLNGAWHEDFRLSQARKLARARR